MGEMRVALGLGVLAAAGTAALGGGCGGSSRVRACTSSEDCAAGLACHPVGRICVSRCASAAECPATQKSCAPAEGAGGQDGGVLDGGSVTICRCQTDQLCGLGFVCNLGIDDQCEPRCSSNDGCREFGSDRKCEVPTGKCVLKTCVDDPGLCAAGSVCNPTTKRCEADPNACDGESASIGANGGPDVCRYGDTCAGGTCAPAPEGPCAARANGPGWNKPARVAPVVASAADIGTDPAGSGGCLGGACCSSAAEKPVKIRVTFYDPTGDMGHTSDLYTNHVKVLTSASPAGAAPANLKTDFEVSPDGRFGSLTFVVCGSGPGSSDNAVYQIGRAHV